MCALRIMCKHWNKKKKANIRAPNGEMVVWDDVWMFSLFFGSFKNHFKYWMRLERKQSANLSQPQTRERTHEKEHIDAYDLDVPIHSSILFSVYTVHTRAGRLLAHLSSQSTPKNRGKIPHSPKRSETQKRKTKSQKGRKKEEEKGRGGGGGRRRRNSRKQRTVRCE